MEIQFDIKLSKSQQEAYDLVHDNRYKYYTFAWSRQSGKSVLMQVLCIEWLLSPNNNIAYVCRNYLLAKKIYRELVKILPKEIVKKVNGADFFIETIYGSTLNFYSAESGASLRGQTFTHLIMDEFAFMKQEQTDGTTLWNDILSPTLKTRGKKCIFVSTPLGKNSLFYDLFLRGYDDNFPLYVSLKKTIFDDGFVTPEQIENLKKEIPDLTFRQEYLTQFLDSSLTFFKGYEQCFSEYTFNDKERIFVGCDLSANGEDATVVTLINESMQVKQYVIEGSLDVKYNRIANIVNSIPRLVAAYLENNGVGAPMVAEIKKLVAHKGKIYEWTTTNSSKEDIVSNMAVRIANKEIFFDKNDNGLFAEFGSFVVKYTKSGKMQFEAQSGKHDDRILSACMALQCKEDFKYQGENKMNFVKIPLRQLI